MLLRRQGIEAVKPAHGNRFQAFPVRLGPGKMAGDAGGAENSIAAVIGNCLGLSRQKAASQAGHKSMAVLQAEQVTYAGKINPRKGAQAKSDSLLTDYTHEIVGTEIHDGQNVYVVKSIPTPDAPVIWGMQMLKIRADFIFLSEEFFDEDLQSVKIMEADEITMLGGRLFPRIWTMRKTAEKDRYTRLTYEQLKFSDTLPDSLFTLGNLRNPRK